MLEGPAPGWLNWRASVVRFAEPSKGQLERAFTLVLWNLATRGDSMLGMILIMSAIGLAILGAIVAYFETRGAFDRRRIR